MTLYGQDRVVCTVQYSTVQYSTINYQYCILPFRRMVKTGHCNVCELDSTASCTGKGSRKKSSTLNGWATKALPPPPPRAQWPQELYQIIFYGIKSTIDDFPKFYYSYMYAKSFIVRKSAYWYFLQKSDHQDPLSPIFA